MANPAERPGPGPRLGPRPLPLHLSLAVLAWQSSKAALPVWNQGLLPWRPGPDAAAEALRRDVGGIAFEAFYHAVERAADRRFAQLLHGIQTYRSHPYRRQMSEPPTVWREGSSRLLDYAPTAPAAAGRGGSKPLLVVPSLINRAFILDLSESTSFMRWLAARGFRPFLMDWDRPGEDERNFGLSDYVAGRLARALDHVLAETGRKPHVIGYCMGGLLALALALRRGEDLSGLALLATPWDFHAEQGAQARLAGASLHALEPFIDLEGELPVDAIQGLFASLDPLQVVRKFIAFGALDPQASKAREFVALEDWVNDGVPLAAPVARECLGEWYARNATARGDWRIAGDPVRPASVSVPSLCVLPGQDRIVPPASAAALARSLPGAEVHQPPAGHVGMIVSALAEARVWRPLADWLAGPATRTRG